MRVDRRIIVAAVAVLAVACFSSEPTAPGGGTVAANVNMTDQFRFDPATVTINVGQAVQWHNMSFASGVTHTATADPAQAQNAADVSLPSGAHPFNSGGLTPGQTFTHTFTVAGTYHYFCIPHETLGMLGTVIVEP